MADTVSDTSGTAYQNSSTYLFVPKLLGTDATVTTDDTNEPGAFFRLGGFSDIESGATGKLPEFYPTQHITDEGSGNAVKNAAGSTAGLSGIMLACSGRLLIRSAERTYLHSTGKIDINTEAELIITTGGNTTITSGGTLDISTVDKDITLTAGSGNFNYTSKALTVTNHAMGHEWKLTDKDSYSFYKCDVYTWKQGGTWDFVAAGKFSYYAGVGLSITSSIDMTISLSAAILFYLAKIEFGVWKIEFVSQKVEIKKDDVVVGDFILHTAVANLWNHIFSSKKTAVKTDETGVNATEEEITADDKIIWTQNLLFESKATEGSVIL